MRTLLLAIFIAALPAFADEIDLTFTPDSTYGSGYAAGVDGVDPQAGCTQPYCVPFSGTLADNDTDDSLIFLNDIDVTFTPSPGSGALTLDQSFMDGSVPGVLIGDPNAATDGVGIPNSYTGLVFGIDIAPGTPSGIYTGTVTIDEAGGDGDPNDNGFTVTQQITVDVLPEPGAASLALIGLTLLGAGCGLRSGLRQKWRSSEPSR